MAKLKTTTVRGVRIEADDVVIALIDRLLKIEPKIARMQQELKEHMEMIAELQPKLLPDGNVTLRAMSFAEDSTEEKTVTIQTVKETAHGNDDLASHNR